jgi:hypothetical protein
MLRRLRRRTGSWRVPGSALAAFAAIYTVSTLLVGPAIGTATAPDAVTPPPAQVEVDHHGTDPEPEMPTSTTAAVQATYVTAPACHYCDHGRTVLAELARHVPLAVRAVPDLPRRGGEERPLAARPVDAGVRRRGGHGAGTGHARGGPADPQPDALPQHRVPPSHSFVLVGADGTITGVQLYAAMFVPLDQLIADLDLS